MANELDARQVEAARRWLATPPAERRAVSPRRAATVMLVRDGVGGIECYLQQRPATMRFAPGFATFPGGAAEPHDGDDLVITAIREVFEETGVLLADRPATAPTVDELEAARALVDAGAPLTAALDALRATPRPDRLLWWMRWVTPEFSPRRFDTTFFAAIARPGDDPQPLTGESERGYWVACRAAVEGELPLMRVTRVALASLAQHASVAELAASATGRDRSPVTPRLIEGSEPPAFEPIPGREPADEPAR